MKHIHRWWPLTMVVGCVVAFVVWQAYDPIERQWDDRANLPDCGSVSLGHGEEVQEVAPEAVSCLQESLESGAGGELEVQWPTEEGDEIRTYYRVTRDGTVEVYEDATADEFGSGDWSFRECETLSSVLSADC